MARAPVLCLVTDRRISVTDLVEAVVAAVRAGVDRVQLRERDLGGAALLALAREIGARVRDADRDVCLLVNRRVDVALAAGWDGVHLGFDGMPVSDARALLPRGARVSVATHAPGELDALADAERPDAAHLAPIWAPRSKAATSPPIGVRALARAAAAGVAILAQGGVTPGRVAACLDAGAAGVAVTGGILGSRDPGAAAAAFRRALDAHPAPGPRGR